LADQLAQQTVSNYHSMNSICFLPAELLKSARLDFSLPESSASLQNPWSKQMVYTNLCQKKDPFLRTGTIDNTALKIIFAFAENKSNLILSDQPIAPAKLWKYVLARVKESHLFTQNFLYGYTQFSPLQKQSLVREILLALQKQELHVETAYFQIIGQLGDARAIPALTKILAQQLDRVNTETYLAGVLALSRLKQQQKYPRRQNHQAGA
jgi:hypothetical protein